MLQRTTKSDWANYKAIQNHTWYMF